jgi:hypothetical protein
MNTGGYPSPRDAAAQSDLDADGEPYDTWTLNNDGKVTHTDRLK